MKRKRKQETCRCSAYSFPHRLYGGKCHGEEEENMDDDGDELYERWRDKQLEKTS
jgi:hypothetical protein